MATIGSLLAPQPLGFSISSGGLGTASKSRLPKYKQFFPLPKKRDTVAHVCSFNVVFVYANDH